MYQIFSTDEIIVDRFIVGETYHSHVDLDDQVLSRELSSGLEVVDSTLGLALLCTVAAYSNHVPMLIGKTRIALYVPTHCALKQVWSRKLHLRKSHYNSLHCYRGMLQLPIFHRFPHHI